MVLLTEWPTYTDDSGDGQSGTAIDEALLNEIKAAIEDHTHSALNATQKPYQTTDEVITARGSMDTLNDRLSGVISSAGVLIVGAAVASRVQLQDSFGAANLLANDTFLLWAAGDAAAPDFFTLAGAGAAVARTGALQFGSETSAPAENTKKKVGNFAAKVTSAAAEATLTQSLLDTAAYPGSTGVFNGLNFGFGCWVWSASVGVRIRFSDGASTTNSSAHTGNSTWQWLSLSHTVSSSATKLECSLVVDAGTLSAYFSGATCLLSPFAPTLWVPAPKTYRDVVWFLVGNASAATKQFEYTFARPTLVKDVALAAITAPTGQALIVDVNKATGGTSMFSTRPELAAAALSGSARPDALYASRCFAKDNVLSIDVDQVGSGTAGAGLGVHLRFLQYARPLEDFLAHDDI